MPLRAAKPKRMADVEAVDSAASPKLLLGLIDPIMLKGYWAPSRGTLSWSRPRRHGDLVEKIQFAKVQ